MSSSYKPALLKALVRIVRKDPAADRVGLFTIGHEFLRLYWTQTVVFRLRQAATLVSEPEVVQAIRSAAEKHGARTIAALPPEVHTRLVSKLAGILRINVLQAFHRSAPSSMPPLYRWTKAQSAIEFTADALHFLSIHAAVLESIANLWWARYLERVNLLAPRIIEKVERNGVERRSSLGRFLKILRELDPDECFYCSAPLASESRTPHVDHVIPWSFLLSDPPWDLVLCCARCNLAKSDTLPRRDFLSKLSVVHGQRAKRLTPVGTSPLHVHESELVQYYDAALSVEWPSGWGPFSSLSLSKR